MDDVGARNFVRWDAGVQRLRGQRVHLVGSGHALSRWVRELLVDAGLDISTAETGAPRPEKRALMCWVVDDGRLPPRQMCRALPTVAVAPYGLGGRAREYLRRVFGEGVVWTPSAPHELLDLMGDALRAASSPAQRFVPIGTLRPEPGAWPSGTLLQVLEEIRRDFRLSGREAEALKGMAIGLRDREMEAQTDVKKGCDQARGKGVPRETALAIEIRRGLGGRRHPRAGRR